jgi:hypothetical protein
VYPGVEIYYANENVHLSLSVRITGTVSYGGKCMFSLATIEGGCYILNG